VVISVAAAGPGQQPQRRHQGHQATGRAREARPPHHRYGSQIDVWRFLVDNRPELWSEAGTHGRLVALALLIAVPPAVALGVAVARRPRLAALAVGTAGVIFTVP